MPRKNQLATAQNARRAEKNLSMSVGPVAAMRDPEEAPTPHPLKQVRSIALLKCSVQSSGAQTDIVWSLTSMLGVKVRAEDIGEQSRRFRIETLPMPSAIMLGGARPSLSDPALLMARVRVASTCDDCPSRRQPPSR